MAQSNSYPSPDRPNDGIHPFYHTHPNQIPTADQQHMPHAATAHMRPGPGNNAGQNYSQMDHGMPHMRQGQPSTPQQLAQHGLAVDQGQDQYGSDPLSRKRTKVSRACDECRRKKIRCDAESETPGIQCSSCKRSGGHCEFSRAPQKRGPSKGYIKELAERVNVLEYRTGATPPEAPYVQEPLTGQFASPRRQDDPKRDVSMVDTPPTYIDYGANQLQQYNLTHSNPRPAPPSREVQDPKIYHRSPDNDPQPSDPNAVVGAEAELLDTYYQLIDPYFPLLPHKADRGLFQFDLANGLSRIRHALIAAIEAALASCYSAPTFSFRRAIDLLLVLQKEGPGSRNIPENIAYLQALVLMIIAIEGSGPIVSKDTSFFGQAVSIATYLGLHHKDNLSSNSLSNQTESIQKAGRRAWLILFTLDRWHAVSKSQPQLIADDHVKTSHDDHRLLGTKAYQLLRISSVLGHLSDAYFYHREVTNTSPVTSTSVFLTRIMQDHVSYLSTSLEDLFPTHPILHLAYLHLKILFLRHFQVYASIAAEMVHTALHMVGILCDRETSPSPLYYHFAALAAATMLETTAYYQKVGDARALHDLQKGLLDLVKGLDGGHFRPLQGRQNGHASWDAAICSFVSKTTNQMRQSEPGGGIEGVRGGLEHLADAAVGSSSAAGGHNGGQVGDEAVPQQTADGGMAWITLKGYLNAMEE